MNVAVHEPRVEAALRCYSLVKRLRPGSPDADGAELAVLYTLSERREATVADDLVRAALHDGRRGVMRAARSQSRTERELAYLSAAGIDTAGARRAAGAEAPHGVVVARDLLAELKRYAIELGGPAPRVLGGLLIGESEHETAAAVCASRSTVTRIRRALRQRASQAGYLPAAA